jgi:predicted transcriptional regulator
MALEVASQACQAEPEASLTTRERGALTGLIRANEQYGNPSLQEIAQMSGKGYYAANIHRFLRSLEAKGYVELGPFGRHRASIRVLKEQ